MYPAHTTYLTAAHADAVRATAPLLTLSGPEGDPPRRNTLTTKARRRATVTRLY